MDALVEDAAEPRMPFQEKDFFEPGRSGPHADGQAGRSGADDDQVVPIRRHGFHHFFTNSEPRPLLVMASKGRPSSSAMMAMIFMVQKAP